MKIVTKLEMSSTFPMDFNTHRFISDIKISLSTGPLPAIRMKMWVRRA